MRRFNLEGAVRPCVASMGMIVMFLFFALLVFAFYEKWEQSNFDKEKASVDTKASLVGIQLVEASQGCSNIGFGSNIEKCAGYKGSLVQEQIASTFALAAIKARDDYAKTCYKFYLQEYCRDLLGRSISISVANHVNTR